MHMSYKQLKLLAYTCSIGKIIPQHSVQNSVFSGLCHISLIRFTTVLKLIEGYVWTIWNHLESVLRLLKKFCGIPSKIPCFPQNLVTGKISLRICQDSYTGIFRPFGTISEVFEKSSADFSTEDFVILCFPESGAKSVKIVK